MFTTGQINPQSRILLEIITVTEIMLPAFYGTWASSTMFIKPNTGKCHGEILSVRFKTLQIPNIWERQQKLKHAFTKKLISDEIRRILATVQFTIFCFSTFYLRT
jgi:hypothetical protein